MSAPNLCHEGIALINATYRNASAASREICVPAQGAGHAVVQFKDTLLERLIALSPAQFEDFAKKLLSAYDFIDMKVTSISRDGGIDEYGQLKVGLATMVVAFQ